MTFIVKTRGAARVLVQDFECPEHGRFELETAPDLDFVPCPFDDCPHDAEWRIAAPGHVKVKAGEVTRGGYQKPERPGWLDTRELGEGMPLDEWKAKRAALREQERKAEVMKFKREG